MTSARAAVEQHGEAINQRDLEGYRAAMNFPFTYQNYNGVALTMDTVADLEGGEPLPWEIILRTDPTWSHTVFYETEEVAASVSSVVYRLEFSRIDTSGVASPRYQAIWIATNRDGHWGVQLRHNLGLIEA